MLQGPHGFGESYVTAVFVWGFSPPPEVEAVPGDLVDGV